MSNFGFLADKKEFSPFAKAAIDAENIFDQSPALCAVGCRKALELAVKWVYAADDDVHMPHRDNLQSLIHEPSFKDFMPEMTWLKLKGIVRVGNLGVHTATQVTRQEAAISLRSLFGFIDWIDYSYGTTYDEKTFDVAAIPRHHDADELNQLQATVEVLKKQLADAQQSRKDAEEKSLDEIRKLSAALTAAKGQKQEERHFLPENLSEFKTRKIYIDVDLKLEGWRFQGSKANVIEELPVRLHEHDGSLRQGQADYVLMGRNGKPLAVVEAKRTCKEGEVGKEAGRRWSAEEKTAGFRW